MRHQRKRHQLSRDSAHRKSLLANLSREVFEHERITTTQAKAKAVKPGLERLITLAKRGDDHARRQVLAVLGGRPSDDPSSENGGQTNYLVHKLFTEIGPRYEDRPGGYTRILKLGPRRSDSTEMVLLELV